MNSKAVRARLGDIGHAQPKATHGGPQSTAAPSGRAALADGASRQLLLPTIPLLGLALGRLRQDINGASNGVVGINAA